MLPFPSLRANNRLTKALFQLTWLIFRLTVSSDIQSNQSGINLRLTGLQTGISLNNPVYGSHLIMEITQFIVKKSVDWTLPLTLSLHFTLNLQSALRSIQSAFYTDCKILQLMNYVMYQQLIMILHMLKSEVKF